MPARRTRSWSATSRISRPGPTSSSRIAGPGELEARRASIPYELAGRDNPRTSRIIRLSPWGQEGPWADKVPANEFTLQAATGSDRLPRPAPNGKRSRSGGRTRRLGSPAVYRRGLGRSPLWRSARQLLVGQTRLRTSRAFEAIDLSCFTIFGDLSSQFIDVADFRPYDRDPVDRADTKDGHVGFCTVTGQQWKRFLLDDRAARISAEDPRSTWTSERVSSSADSRVRAGRSSRLDRDAHTKTTAEWHRARRASAHPRDARRQRRRRSRSFDHHDRERGHLSSARPADSSSRALRGDSRAASRARRGPWRRRSMRIVRRDPCRDRLKEDPNDASGDDVGEPQTFPSRVFGWSI